jgi:hypothetical protein
MNWDTVIERRLQLRLGKPLIDYGCEAIAATDPETSISEDELAPEPKAVYPTPRTIEPFKLPGELSPSRIGFVPVGCLPMIPFSKRSGDVLSSKDVF